MPRMPDHPCAHPGCPRLVPRGRKYCEEHAAQHPEEVRPASERGYGSAWRRARKRYLEAHPLCVECMKEGRYTKATDVDHIVPHSKGGQDTLENTRICCRRCNQSLGGKQNRKPVPVQAIDLDVSPIW